MFIREGEERVSIENFIPELWVGRILSNLNNDHVYCKLASKDFTGEIEKLGDKVHINSIGRITIKSYTKNGTVAAPDTLTDSTQALEITERDYFNFEVDDIDKKQQKPKVMEEAMREAAYGFADASDAWMAALMAAATTNVIDAVGSAKPTADTAYEYLVDCGVKLSEKNVPKQGRFVVVPPWFYGLLLKDDRFVTYDKVGDAITNGLIGAAAGFKVYESNNVPNTNDATYQIIAGHKMATAYAEQINKVEAFRPQDSFSDALKGLHLYGGKILRDEALVILNAERASVVS
jgi:N4-gp56 family major capsid protein